jgi:hypothetical protein
MMNMEWPKQLEARLDAGPMSRTGEPKRTSARKRKSLGVDDVMTLDHHLKASKAGTMGSCAVSSGSVQSCFGGRPNLSWRGRRDWERARLSGP